MTTSTLAFSDLYAAVSRFLGWGSSPSGDNATLCKAYANAGHAEFLMGMDPRTKRVYQWSFLQPSSTIDLWPDVAVTAGVTATGVYSTATTITANSGLATFYPSMVGKSIVVTDVGTYTIASYVSSTQITIAGSHAFSTKTFSIASDKTFTLPSDFGGIIDDPAFTANRLSVSLRSRSPQFMREYFAMFIQATGTPLEYGIEASTATSYEMMVWPLPSILFTMAYRYRITPALLSADTDVPYGGLLHSQTILEAALAVAEQRSNDTAGLHTARFAELMAQSIDLDCQNRVGNLGPNYDSSGVVGPAWYRRGVPVNYL